MSVPAIRVQNIGKRYRIGTRTALRRNFGEALLHLAAAPWRRWRAMGESAPAAETLWALRGVSFDVQPGEVVGLIGSNGAGKSTLLKILSRITTPTTGEITLRGQVRSLLEVGTGFHPELTGRENVYLNGAILGMRKAEIDRQFDAIVAYAEIERFLDTPVKRYSSGMYVRLAFAVAAHLQPEILIVDEVLAVGDAAFQAKCLGTMGRVAKAGRTVLFVSHNMAAVRSLCSRGVVLHQGQVEYDGPIGEAMDRYLTRGTALSGCATFTPDAARQAEIVAVEVRGPNNQATELLDAARGGSLRLRYQVRDWPQGAYVAVLISTASGVDVLWSCDTRAVAALEHPRPAGEYEGIVQIPAGLLAAGRYVVSAGINDPRRDRTYDYRQRCVQFEVVDSHSLLAQLGVRSPCPVALPLEWMTESAGGAVPRAPSDRCVPVEVATW